MLIYSNSMLIIVGYCYLFVNDSRLLKDTCDFVKEYRYGVRL